MKLRINKTVGAIAAAGLAMVAIGTSMNPAFADPTNPSGPRALAGVGSDTTFNVMNGLSNVVLDGGVKKLASYDPIPSGRLITPKAPGTVDGDCDGASGTGLVSPNGSSAGRNALIASLTNNNALEGCYDFARSSSLNQAAVPAATGGLTYVPFAAEAYSYAVKAGGAVPTDLTLDDVKAIYRCEAPAYQPYLPQTGSGSRAYWLGVMGITETDLLNGSSCVLSTKAGANFQENDPRQLTKGNEIMPMSVANYVSMANGFQTDNRGSSVLANLDAKPQVGAGSGQSLVRDVYNIIPTAKEAVAPWSTHFVGGSSLICQQGAEISKYGFSTISTCGDPALKAPTS